MNVAARRVIFTAARPGLGRLRQEAVSYGMRSCAWTAGKKSCSAPPHRGDFAHHPVRRLNKMVLMRDFFLLKSEI